MPKGLVALIIILVIFAIIVLFFMFLMVRRISIVFKKLDYLSEDLIYKSESLSSVIDAIKGFSKYIVLIQTVLDESDDPIRKKHLQENKKKIQLLANYLNKIVSDNEQTKPD